MKESGKTFREVDSEMDEIAKEIVDCAYRGHSGLGPGLLENACEISLAYEISQRGLKVRRQVDFPMVYKEVRLDAGFRLDLWIEKKVIVEVKAIEQLLPVHRAQVITYLKLSGN
jgi:GxxExxY protein